MRGNFFGLKQRSPRPLIWAGFTSAQLVLGNLPGWSKLIKLVLRKILITGSNAVPVTFYQKLSFKARAVHIQREIVIEGDQQFHWLQQTDFAAFIYVPSSRYFDPSHLQTRSFHLRPSDISRLNAQKKLIIKEKIQLI